MTRPFRWHNPGDIQTRRVECGLWESQWIRKTADGNLIQSPRVATWTQEMLLESGSKSFDGIPPEEIGVDVLFDVRIGCWSDDFSTYDTPGTGDHYEIDCVKPITLWFSHHNRETGVDTVDEIGVIPSQLESLLYRHIVEVCGEGRELINLLQSYPAPDEDPESKEELAEKEAMA